MAILPTSLFGLTVEPKQKYTTSLEDDTHITMACLPAELPKNASRTSVIVALNGVEFTLCSLTPGLCENQSLDIFFHEDDEITFRTVGNCPVDITGNTVAMLPDAGFDSEEDDEDLDVENMTEEEIERLNILIVEAMKNTGDEEDSEEEIDIDNMTDEQILEIMKEYGHIDEDDDEEIDSDTADGDTPKIQEVDDDEEEDDDEKDGEEEEEDDEDDDEEEMEVDEALIKELNKRVASENKSDKKRAKIEEKPQQKKEKESKKEPKKADGESKKVEKTNGTEEVSTKKTLPSGLVMEDHVVGNGPRAKKGKKVSVRYIGKLQNGKVFDSNTKGKPFDFRLGGGEVIKGWDLGVAGMCVGGTRKLTIPPALAYGSRGAPPDIPKNATLTFEVKLLQVK